jgi:glycosyltransferase involved in cell wall biosynthesis
VGDGSERSHLEKLTAKLGINEVITFAGQVPRSHIEEYYQLIDVFPLPRKPYPVCHLVPPLKPFEIMAQGKPIIVSDLQPLTEIVKHRETGLVFKAGSVSSLAEAIKLLYSDPAFAAELAESGRRWVINNRTWKHNVVLYERLYNQL